VFDRLVIEPHARRIYRRMGRMALPLPVVSERSRMSRVGCWLQADALRIRDTQYREKDLWKL
jgi:hypothetical protein